jgi:hypothetical protein
LFAGTFICGCGENIVPIDANRRDAPRDSAVADARPADAVTADAALCATSTFAMDGVLDSSARVIAGGVTTLRIAFAISSDGKLYVATDDAGEGSDHFIVVSATAPGGATRAAPFAKAGTIAAGAGALLALADENDNNFAGWFRLEAGGGDTALTGSSYVQSTGGNGGVLEGVVDLTAAFGAVPTTIYLAAVPYATADAGALVSAAQTPQGNGDGNVDAAEFVAVSLSCR